MTRARTELLRVRLEPKGLAAWRCPSWLADFLNIMRLVASEPQIPFSQNRKIFGQSFASLPIVCRLVLCTGLAGGHSVQPVVFTTPIGLLERSPPPNPARSH